MTNGPRNAARGPDVAVDVAPDLVDRGPGTESDRDSICSLPGDGS